MAKPRLFVENMRIKDNQVTIEGDAHHYLSRVMRMREGQELAIFDGQSDSLNAKIIEVSKRATRIEITGVEKPYFGPPNLTLAFAPIKKARTDFIVEKAVELGARALQPMITQFTSSERVRIDRLQAHAIEATEQCGANFVPKVLDPLPLESLLAQNPETQLLFCDEAADKHTGQDAFIKTKAEHWTILIGPEGGFSETEREYILSSGALQLSLGPRILRADTAAVAALTLWQKTHGDW